MNTNGKKKVPCQVCGKIFCYSELFPIKLLQHSVLELFVHDHPNSDKTGYLCYPDLRELRTTLIEQMLKEDKGALSILDQDVLQSLESKDIRSENVNKKFDRKLTFGEKIADKVAQFGGSWKFIISFLIILIIWMTLNDYFLLEGGFDPYPFILLNLVLSCLAAIQAPIILMSQNRQVEKERLRSNEEYCTNLKAELEIQQLNSKFDFFMKRQWETMIELQKLQIDLTEEILHPKKK